MFKIGLTGVIGSGKAEVASILASLGAAVIYADQISRQIYEPGDAGHQAVVDTFGEDVLDEDERIDRAALAAIVFGDEAQRRRLENAVWPVMAAVVEKRLAAAEAEGAPAAVIEAAVLFEAGWDRLVDEVWAVTADEAASVLRVRRRDGASEDQVRARMAAQLSAGEKAARANRVIVNDGSLEDLRECVEQVWNEVTGEGR
ncbi:MAG: dephospho-CoA kinase [Chloroflexi bacterium]|nr:dephospho-CoA kinase [Chloroflexota bacterium]